MIRPMVLRVELSVMRIEVEAPILAVAKALLEHVCEVDSLSEHSSIIEGPWRCD
jgi:hypothetical protein